MRLALHLAVRLLRRRGGALLRTSAVAALAAVVLGVASLVVVLGLMSGYRDALRRGILAGGGHMVALFPGGLSRPDAERFEARLRAIRAVERTTETLYLPGLIFPNESDTAELVTVKAAAVPPPFVKLAAPPPRGPLPAAIGETLAHRAGAAQGDVLRLQLVAGGGMPRSVTVRVTQVYHTGFAELDDRWAVVSLSGLRDRVGGVEANGIEVWLRDPDRAEAEREAVDAACGGKALVTTWEENNRNLFAALRWQKISLAIVLSLVLGVGAFEVASALVVLVTEKRREFGILLALGGQPRLIRETLLLAGGSLGAAGVALGLAVGVALAGVLTALGVPRFPPDIAAIYLVDRIPLRVEASDLLLVVLLGVAEVLLAALLPAQRAASRDPVEVLRWV